MRYLNKKGNLGILVPGILALCLGSIILIFGLLIMQTLYEDTDDTLTSVVNETLTTVTEKGERVAFYSQCQFSGFSVSACINKTGQALIPTTNYTTNSSGQILYKPGGDENGYNNSDWQCNYTFYSGREACMKSNTTLVAAGTFGDYFDLVALAIIVAIIVGLVLVVAGKRAGRQ